MMFQASSDLWWHFTADERFEYNVATKDGRGKTKIKTCSRIRLDYLMIFQLQASIISLLIFLNQFLKHQQLEKLSGLIHYTCSGI